MDGRRYLALAQQLVEGSKARTPLTGGDGAPECRTAVSRAYYATFLVAAAFLDRIGFAVENTHAAHSAVQRALNNSGDEVLRDVARYLDTLHKDRRKADYEMRNVWPEVPANAELVVDRAANAVAKLDDVRDTAAPERLGAVAAAVSAWLKGAQTAGLRQKPGTR